MSYTSNPNFQAALDYIASHDLNALQTGRHEIDGDNLFLNICDSQMKTPQQARLEVHDKYIDIQIPLDKEEVFGVKDRAACVEPDGEMNIVKDILFYKDPVGQTVTVKAGEMIVFAPDQAHAPLIGEGMIHKAIFKVKVV